MMNHIVRRNELLSLIIGVLTAVAALSATGTLMQTFLATLGFSTGRIYIHTTVTQAVNVLVLLLGSGWVNTENAIRRYAIITLPYGLLFLCYIPACFRADAGTESFVFLLLISVFQALTTALRTVGSYTLPYLLYPADQYGPFLAVSGVLSSVVSILLGALVTLLVEALPFVTLMVGAFAVSCALIVLESALTLMQRSILKEDGIKRETPRRERLPLSVTFRHPAFYTLMIPALLRGFASGTITVMATLAFDIGFNETVTAKMVFLQSIANLSGCAVIGFSSKYLTPRLPIFVGSLSFLLLPLIFIGKAWVFLAVYAVVFFGRTLVDNGVPLILRFAVPADIAGPYNAWRMMLHTGGSLIATSVAIAIPSEALVALTVITSILSGAGFFFSKVLREASPFFHSMRKTK